MQNQILKLFLHFDVLEYLNLRWLPDAIFKMNVLAYYYVILYNTSFMGFSGIQNLILVLFLHFIVLEYLNSR